MNSPRSPNLRGVASKSASLNGAATSPRSEPGQREPFIRVGRRLASLRNSFLPEIARKQGSGPRSIEKDAR